MSVKPLTRSFAGGEIGPLLLGRVDLGKNQTGLALARNFRPTPQGPVENRPGFAFVSPCRYHNQSIALIPFSFNSEQTFALEFGALTIRFHTQGGTLLEPSIQIASIVLGGFTAAVTTVGAHGYSNGDHIVINGRWYEVFPVDADTFNVHELWTNAPVADLTGTECARVYTVFTPYVAADLFDLRYVQSADVLTIVHPNYAPRELRRLAATNWTLSTIGFAPAISTPTINSVVPVGAGANVYSYAVTAVATGTGEESLQSATVTVTNDLSVTGQYNTITITGVSGAARYNVFKLSNGLFGQIGQTDNVIGTFVDDNITPDMSKTPPLSNSPLTGAGNYPRAASYFEQRRCFAGTANKSQNVFMTRSATESNMTYSIPTQDDDAIEARIVAREANAVRHLVPLGDLLALTAGGVWRIAAVDGGAITPASFSAKPQGYVGASNAQPVVTSQSVLYSADRGAHMREVTYKPDASGLSYYTNEDVSVLAPHLFDYRSIVQLAYAKAPIQSVLAVRDDGLLLGMTHQPEHDVRAWYRIETDGEIESICAVAEGTEDGVYAVVAREINGATVRYIERMHSRRIDAIADSFFVDCGSSYSGTPVSTITGLWWLEGESVVGLADGVPFGPVNVENGAIALPTAASIVHVGLAYTCDLQTLPLASEALAAFGHGVAKNINQVVLRVIASAPPQVGPSFDKLKTASGSGLLNGIVRIKPMPEWQEDGSVCIRQANPLPLTITSMTLEVETGG